MEAKNKSYTKIVPPTNCPCCGSLLELVKDQLFCRAMDCSETATKKVDAFAKVLKIKGLGIKTIEKLGITDIVRIYELPQEEINNLIGEALGTKLYASIQESRTVSLATLVRSFSIPLVGKVASEKLSEIVSSIEEITNETCLKAKLGEKTTANLLDWLKGQWEDENKNKLLDYLTITAKVLNNNKELGLSVVITGKLDNYKNRQEAASFLKERGYTVKSSVTKNVDFLISEEGRESSSTKKAKVLGIPILSIIELTQDK